MANDSGRHQRGSGIDHAANDARRWDLAQADAGRINGLYATALERAAVQFRVVAQDELDAAAADSLEVRPAGKKRDALTGERQLDSGIAADGPRSYDCDLHRTNLKK